MLSAGSDRLSRALALWGGICAFVATVLRNFASYSAALAGYTAAIIAADTLGATGGPSTEVFMLAVSRASEICIGIVCAGVVLAGTDLGGAQRRLAASFANLAAEITGRFTRMLALAGPQMPDTQTERRELVRRVIALDPMIDQALGESSHVRYHSSILQTAVHGLFRALDGWRGSCDTSESLAGRRWIGRAAEAILSSIPPSCDRRAEPGSPARWMADPVALRRVCEERCGRLLALPTDTPSLRLLADETAKVLTGMLHVLDGLALLVDAPGRPSAGHRSVQLGVPDWLPALVNAARAFVTIGAVELFWVATAWPNGASAIVFAAIVVLLLSPKGDLAYGGSIAFALGTAARGHLRSDYQIRGAAGLRNVSGLLPRHRLFPHTGRLCHGAEPTACDDRPCSPPWPSTFMPLLSPTNQMSYDTVQFYNTALAIVAGCGVAPLAFRLLPPLSPALRARRLLASPCATCVASRSASLLPTLGGLGGPHVRPARGIAGPGRAVAALAAAGGAVGRHRDHSPSPHGCRALGRLRSSMPRSRPSREGNSAIAIARLRQLDRRLASESDAGPETAIALRARGRILVISEALAQHGSYFDAGAPA